MSTALLSSTTTPLHQTPTRRRKSPRRKQDIVITIGGFGPYYVVRPLHLSAVLEKLKKHFSALSMPHQLVDGPAGITLIIPARYEKNLIEIAMLAMLCRTLHAKDLREDHLFLFEEELDKLAESVKAMRRLQELRKQGGGT